MTSVTTEKLQKVLAHLGYGSRREIEDWLKLGRVSVNGKLAKLGDRIGPQDKVALDGKLLRQSNQKSQRRLPVVLSYYKPEGQICSKQDPNNHESVFKYLPKCPSGRWVMVGRLDLNSSGLLLFTNDGELANRLMHPSYEVPRQYAVRVLGEFTPAHKTQLLQGVQLEDGPAKFTAITDAGGKGANRWYHVSLQEGKKREVRRLFESQGLKVSRLIRLRYGPISLPPYSKPGSHWLLKPQDIKQLCQAVSYNY